jgi:hypothetical protein
VKTTREEVIKELWTRGELSWLLYRHQLPIYKKIREVIDSSRPDMNSYVVDCARQFGKSFTEFLIACEYCMQNPGWTIVFLAPLKSQVNEIINGRTFGTIFATCPRDLMPSHKDSALHFTNGSRIRLAGTDNKNYETLRGGAANVIFMDEAGFMSDLEDGVLPTVEPMTKTTSGKVIFSSTPPENLDHDYYEVLRYHDEAGLISTYTIWDDKSLTPDGLQKIINQCRGRETTKFKREFECQRIADTSRQVIPNYTDIRRQASVIPNRRDPLYKFWKKYVVADWGGRDKTAIIFAHYNYNTRTTVIEHYLDYNGSDIVPLQIAQGVREYVDTHWVDSESIQYICDSNNPLIQQDMNITYRLPFIPTTKGRLDAMVERVKDWEFNERIKYWPTAEYVSKSVAAAHWTKNRDEFARSSVYGHYDHTAALIYLIRNVDESTNPVPALHNVDQTITFVMPTQENLRTQHSLGSIFKKGPR